MPNPSNLHISKALTGVAIAYAEQEFIADLVLPKIKVDKQTDKYRVYGAEKYGRPRTKYNPRALPAEVDYTLSEDTFYAEDYGLRRLVLNREKSMNDQPITDPEQDTTELLSNLIKLDREVRVQDLIFTATNYAVACRLTLTGADQFSDDNSTPKATIKDMLRTVQNNRGMRPNLLVMGHDVWDRLEDHPEIVSRLKYTDPLYAKDKVAAYLGVQKIHVGSAIYDAADENQTFDGTDIWGDKIAGYFVPPALLSVEPQTAPNLFFGDKTPTFAAQFVFENFTVKRLPDPYDRGSEIWVVECQDEKVTGSSFGFLISDVLAG